MKLFSKKLEAQYSYIIAKEVPTSYVTESLQKMIVNIEYANVDKKYKVLQFTSGMQAEGKTTLLSNVAYLLRQRGKRVLVLDLDLRRPKVHRIYGVLNQNGITDYLLGKIDKATLIKKNDDGIDYTVGGEKTTSIVQVLESQKLEELIKELKNDYDYILVDTPPMIVVSDSLLVNKIVDGVIFVVGYGQSKKAVVKEAISIVKKSDTPIVGVVITQDKVNSGRNYGYSYRYKYNYKYDD